MSLSWSIGTIACEASSVSGSTPMTIAASSGWPASSAMRWKVKVWRGRTSTPRRLGPVSWQRWIETFCFPVFGLRTIMMPAAM
jgi:hypothetical protein